MGISFSCPFSKYNDVEDNLNSIVVKSINFGDDKQKTLVRSVSFKNQDSEPKIPKSPGSGKMTIEALVSFKRRDLEKIVSTKTLSFENEKNMPTNRINQKSQGVDDMSSRSNCQVERIQPAILDPSNPKHMAAIKLQKVYKSFRTRRKLADCAILVEQSWWKLLDFAELKRSSISFFDIEKHESAMSRWSRARTRAAKVGKGLSKDDKAQKLALQHWLEAIDPRHRYGHNLHFYYDKWLHCHSREPFFYWLDIGEGKEVNLQKCPRSKLQQQCIKYLGPMERLAYEVVVKDGRLFYKQSGELLQTAGDVHVKWIFVLSTSKTLYVGKKIKGAFQHSSFLAGGATSAAGRLVVEHGVLEAVWPHSGHYRPTEANFKEFISFLQQNNVNLSDVKMTPVDEVDELCPQRSSSHLRSHSSEEDFTENISGFEDEKICVEDSVEEKANLMETEIASTLVAPMTRPIQILGRELSRLEIPTRGQLLVLLDNEKVGAKKCGSLHMDDNEKVGAKKCDSLHMDSLTVGHEAAQAFISKQDHMVTKPNFPEENLDENEIETIQESILKRINSRKEAQSYQLGKQLSCKWTTGAGPRIGCVRDYPSELQLRALEQVSLSPRSGCRSKTSSVTRTAIGLSPRLSTPTTFCGDAAAATIGTRAECSLLIRGTSVIPIIHTKSDVTE